MTTAIQFKHCTAGEAAKGRATEKTVIDLHAQALDEVEKTGFHNMIAFYAQKVA